MFLPYTATIALTIFAYGIWSQYLVLREAEEPASLEARFTKWNVLGSINLS